MAKGRAPIAKWNTWQWGLMMTSRATTWFSAVLVSCLAACAPASDSGRAAVDYTEQPAALPVTPPAGLGGLPSNSGGAVAPTQNTDPGIGAGPAAPTGTGQAAPTTPQTNPAAPAGSAGAAAAPMAAGTGGTGAPMTGSAAGATGGTAGAGDPGGGTTAGPKPTMLSMQVTTVTQGGRYAPKNVGAIWVEDSSGKWVYTLEYWDGFINAQWLTAYQASGGPAYVPVFSTIPPDVTASATLNAHKTHNVTWSLKDSKGNTVPDGAYKLVVEVTEYSGTGKSQSYDFNVGPDPVDLSPPDTQYYTGVKVTLK